jgi:hypothetical protein
MEGNVVGFSFGKDCIGAPQQPLDFATTLNMWDLTRCLEHDNLHHRHEPLHAIGFGFNTTSILNHREKILKGV